MKTIVKDGICLWPLSVIPHFSHAKGGRVKGLGPELGFYRGVGASGDHGVNSWLPQKHGKDECGLGSQGPAVLDGPRSTPFYLFYALDILVPERGPPWSLEGASLVAPPSRGGEGVGDPRATMAWGSQRVYFVRFFMPELRETQFRAALRLAQGYIGWEYSLRALNPMFVTKRFTGTRGTQVAGVYRRGGRIAPKGRRAGPVRGPGGPGGGRLLISQLTRVR